MFIASKRQQSIKPSLVKILILLSAICTNYSWANPPLYETCYGYPKGQFLYDRYPNDVLIYYGVTFSDAFVRLLEGDFHRWPEHIETIEYGRTLDFCNPVRRFFYPIVGVVQLAVNVDVRNGANQNTIYEIDPYIGFRWANFPWNNWVTTSFSLGEGVSYTTSIPSLEKRNNTNTKRLLNYMLVEITFAFPHYPRLQLVGRVHHRSGAYGLYHAGNTGSNNLGLGIRYLFD